MRSRHLRDTTGAGRERGFALVVSMLVLLVMTLLGLVLMASVVLNRSLAGNDQRMRGSLNVAEAGVSEAMSRIKGDPIMDPTNINAVAQVFNTVQGSVPALGQDSIGLATGQPAGAFLNYSTAGRSGDALTIAWKKDPTGTKIMHWDGTLNPKIQAVASGFPFSTMYVESTVATPLPLFFAACTTPAGMKNGLPASTVWVLPSTSSSIEPAST